MKGENLLKHALQIVEDRRAQYGDSTQMFNEASKRWSITLGGLDGK
jgi:hypothetical protein